ncbi:retrovirus-related pol polyprotein from transposon TNT 1-94 [Tanacetum coccineum]
MFWNLEGDDLLTGSCDSNLYTISIFEMAASSPVCLMSRATSTKSWLWHRRLSHLNFGTINQLTSKDLVDGIPKFKYNKDHLCPACKQVEAARTMLIFSKTLEFLWAEAIATACFTQNRSIDLGKMKPNADIGIFIGYSESSREFCIYNRRTKKIMEMIHVKFDELTAMASECNNSKPGINCMNFQDSSKDLQSVPSKTYLDNLFGPFQLLLLSQMNSRANSIPLLHITSATEPNSLVLNENADELIQEDVVEFDGNVFYNEP